MRIEAATEAEIGKPLSEVFAFVDDNGKLPQWLSLCASLQQKTPGPKTTGTELHYEYKAGGGTRGMDGKVVEYVNDQKLAMRFEGRMFDVQVSFGFRATGSSTVMRHEMSIEPKSFMARLMSPLIRSQTRKQLVKDTEKLKQILERGQAGAPR